jgi:hypothetical protein
MGNDTQVVASNSFSSEQEVEAGSPSRRNGSIWTIIGCAFANLFDGYQQNLVIQSS